MRSISTLTLAGVVTLGLVGCGKSSEKPQLTGPVTVSFGDCAAPGTYFESGPRPRPFDADDVERRMKTLASANQDEGRKPPATEEDREPEEGRGGKENREEDKRRRVLEEGDGAFVSITGTADFSSGLDDRSVYGGIVGDEVGEMEGGFGASGFGPGGGGTGWGTIGTSKYGTIGHSDGTGSGYGTGRGRGMGGRRGVAQVQIGNSTVDGDLDKSLIRRYIRRKLPRIKYCYEKQLLVKPKLRGTVVASFVIAPEGNVAKSKASGVNKRVSSCVEGVIATIQFPKPRSGGEVKVSYPFSFSPGSEAPKQPTPVPLPEPAPKAPPTPPRPEPKQQPAKTAARKIVEGYQAGKDNPLRPRRAALEACIRKQSRRYGVFVVELEVEAGGAVKAAKTLGNNDKSLATCVAKVAREVTWQEAKADTYRCPVSFGPMAVADLPGVDITDEHISFTAGPGTKARVVDETQRIVKDTAREWKLVELYEILRQHQRARDTELPAKVVSITGPAIIRPVATTPMKVVDRALMTTAAAGFHAGLAAQDNQGWRLLPHARAPASDALPIAPVPLGTGDIWYASPKRIVVAADVEVEPKIRMSILITEGEIWVGLSVVSEFVKILKEGNAHNLALLRETLAKHAAGPLAGRNDVEIGAEHPVAYRDVVSVIDTVVASGFDSWAIADPSALSAGPGF